MGIQVDSNKNLFRMVDTLTPKRYYTFMLDPELAEALKTAKEQSPEFSEAGIIRQALRDYFRKHGVTVRKKTERKRPASRKRS